MLDQEKHHKENTKHLFKKIYLFYLTKNYCKSTKTKKFFRNFFQTFRTPSSCYRFFCFINLTKDASLQKPLKYKLPSSIKARIPSTGFNAWTCNLVSNLTGWAILGSRVTRRWQSVNKCWALWINRKCATFNNCPASSSQWGWTRRSIPIFFE